MSENLKLLKKDLKDKQNDLLDQMKISADSLKDERLIWRDVEKLLELIDKEDE